jgi:transposase
MTIVQSKLKEVLDKGSLNSLDRLSVVLQTNELCETETGNEPMDDVLPDVVDVEEEEPLVVAKGENRVPTKKRKHQKYRLQKKPMEERKGRTKPRFYCEF